MASLADYRLLQDDDALVRRGLFVAEGRLVVSRLIQDGRHNIRSVLVSPTARAALGVELSRLGDAVPVFERPVEDFLAITGFNIHRGCLALVERPAEGPVDQVLTGARTVVVLDGVANADNVGGVFRNAAAFGVDAVLMSPTCGDPLYRKAVRTSMAATTRVPFARVQPWPAALSALRSDGWTLAALTPTGASLTLDEFAAAERPGRLALIVGAEGAGVSGPVLAMSDVRVRIPIREGVDSLNLAVATGIALARVTKDAK
jgi:tRNA G18 (ribose-2'-O)-methylase SpoU